MWWLVVLCRSFFACKKIHYFSSSSLKVKYVFKILNELITLLFLGVKLSKRPFRSLWIQKQPSRCVMIKRCFENMQKVCRRISMLKYDFNKVAETALRHGCSPLNLLRIFRTRFPKNTWTTASVSWEINFEKWEKICLDHDENTFTCFFAVEQVNIIMEISPWYN